MPGQLSSKVLNLLKQTTCTFCLKRFSSVQAKTNDLDPFSKMHSQFSDQLPAGYIIINILCFKWLHIVVRLKINSGYMFGVWRNTVL